MKVATIQFCPKFNDAQGNMKRIISLVVQAAKNGAKIIVLPELAISGYSFMNEAEAAPFAEVITDFDPQTPKKETASMNVMFLLCQRLGICVAWGTVGKEAGTGKLYNAQILMQPSGKYAYYYKINGWGNDFLWACSGKANPTIEVIEGKKVGLLICRDVRDKYDSEWKSFYQKGDADIVLLSCAWGDGGFPAVAWMNFAKENGATLIVSNRYGQEKNNDFGEGGVCIIYPNQKVICDGLEWEEDCIVYGEV